MYKVKVLSNFSAAHFLRNYKGKCENLHGHNWKVEVVVASLKLNSLGMVMDFSDLKKLTKNMLEELDHACLNDLEYFSAKGGKHNPSSEEIARYIFDKLKTLIAEKNCQLEEILVWETESSCATYRE
ncbi:MAG: 6-carboxytetrahydropterin synthase QueD [Candidatus Omnitrophica bacterium]|nr:6-carboxytetrahydropterin synthase QueD [Candidatus Omnitrophota bacterium]MBU2045083.1 6-carboxytetrahydropterin synthase QueD [Candidatus Omnitrophota bacterium]MBU2473180.1 6-carboxytetrahydropterin synthase QueD [Candidatus Omnitrophota bacterium]